MKEALFIKLHNEKDWLKPLIEPDILQEPVEEPEFSARVSAIYYGRGHEGEAFSGTLEELKSWIQEVRGDFFDLQVSLLLSGVNLVAMEVNIPSKQAKHIHQALPFMLEDHVAQDVDSLHIALGDRRKSGELQVLLCQKSVLGNIKAHFEQAGISISNAYADMYCLPSEENAWAFLTDGRSLLMRTDELNALTIELDALPVVLNSLFLEGQPTPDRINVIVTNDHMSENLENWLKTQFTSHLGDVSTEFEIQHSELSSFHYLCESMVNADAVGMINLLQGEFKPVSQRRPSLIKWKPMAALAAVFVVFFVGFQYTQAWKIEDQTARVDKQTKDLYKRYFPQDRNVTDIKRRMKSKLDAAGSEGSSYGFLTLLTLVGEKLNETNRGASSPRLSPIRITFDQNQGDLKIDFIAGGFSDLDALKAKLESMNLVVEIARASQDGEQMKARMNIRSAG
ncbi:MAG: type II secretion system protein GspL [Pseudomonadales bacterium]|nr:type II secretion system protein GspL [Pseudomonadales bacterium]